MVVDESLVDVEREGPVARIFLNRPEKANALDSAVLALTASTAGPFVATPVAAGIERFVQIRHTISSGLEDRKA